MGGFLEIPIASALFLLLFVGSLARYLREPSPLAGVVVLIFGALSPLFAGRLLDAALGMALPPAVQSVALLGVLLQPLLSLWLASRLEATPSWALPAASLALALAAPVAFLSPPPGPLLILAIAAYVGTSLAAGLLFFRAGRRRVGSARLRLEIASGATLLMATTLLVVSVAQALPTGGELAAVAARYGVLLAAIGFVFAFAAPAWLREQWNARTAYEMSRRLLAESAENDEQATWLRYLELVTQAAGMRHGALVASSGPRAGSLLAAVGSLAEPQELWTRARAERLLELVRLRGPKFVRLSSESAVQLFSGSPRHIWLLSLRVSDAENALLVLADEQGSLFTSDDSEMFETLGREAALLAERAATGAERTVLNERLSATVDALRAAHQTKSDFLASMSHELRTPLNAILGFSDLMRTEPLADGRRQVPAEWVEHVHVAGRHLLSLINDVLDLAKVEAGRLDLQPEQISLRSAVAEAIAGLRPLAVDKELALTSEVEAVDLNADRGRLRQILYNLLSNAIKYTPRGGSVAVTAARVGSFVHIAVSDDGVGIAPEDHERVFEEFSQVGDPQSRQEGTGLGLALTRRLVEAHGGRLTLKSARGAGSTFTVELPLASPPEVAGMPGAETFGANTEVSAVHAPPPSLAARSTPGGVARKVASAGAPVVLAIEDDPQALVLLRSCVEPSGYRLVVAADGEAGLEIALRERPAAILLDVLLPGLDGWEVLRRLKADERLANIPVLMITVVDEREVGLALGAADYLVKPVERDALLQALARHAPGQGNGARPRILAVDDDPTTLAVVEANLREYDCELLLASSGEQALALARSGPLDLVICDLVMPDLDGFEVIARLRADPRTSDSPILVLTGQQLGEADKRRLNGHIVGVCSKGEEAGLELREWFTRVGVNGGRATATSRHREGRG